MEALEIDDSPLTSDSNEVSRITFVDLWNFCNQKHLKTKFHEKFMRYLQKLRFSNEKDFSVIGISGIGKSFTLVYYVLDCLKNNDESVHYIDLKKSDFKIESFFKYAKIIKERDLIIVDHVTLLNKHLIAEIAEIRKRMEIAILTVETGLTASNCGRLTTIFGKDYLLDEEDFNQMWISQSLENADLRESGREVYRQGALNGLPTPRLLHKFFCMMDFGPLSLAESVHQYVRQQIKNIDDFVTQEAGDEYQSFLLHSRLLLHFMFLSEDEETILTQQQYRCMKIAVNIFDVQSSFVTKENLEQDGTFHELDLNENNIFYRLSLLVPSYADFWKQRLPYHFELVLQSPDFSNLVSMFQCGRGRKEIENLMVEAQKKHGIVLAPFTSVTNTTYEKSENECLIPQVNLQFKQLDGQVYTVKLKHLQHFNAKFGGSAKNVAKCAMWIKEKVEVDPEHDFILHPDISDLMGVDYFCKTKNFMEGTVKKPKYKNCLLLVQVATGSSHNGRAVGEALNIVKEVLAEVDLTVHVVIAIVLEDQSGDYCLKKCSFENASAINLANGVFMDIIKPWVVTLYDFIMKVKSLNK